MRQVERMTSSDGQAIARWLERAEAPVVIAGGASGWSAVERWNPAYLTSRLGPITLPYKSSSSNAHPDLRERGLGRMFARGEAPLPDFLHLVTTGPESERCRYLFTGDERPLLRRRNGQTSIDPELAPLLADVQTPGWFDAERLHTVWAWFSGAGVRTWLHYDNNGCHNLNAQLTGRKRCVLYPPEELARMHVFGLGGDNPAHNVSRIDVERPQPEHAADLAAADAWQAELGPGDMLYIPAWWFHTFLHLGELNSNVNFWWKPERPVWNPVAARQALVDAAAAARLDPKDASVARVLAALDAAAQAGGAPSSAQPMVSGNGFENTTVRPPKLS